MDISIDGDCLFHLVGLGGDVAKMVMDGLGELGMVGVCFSGFDEYRDAMAMPSFIFPLALFCSMSEVSRAMSVQQMQGERRIRLVALGESAKAQPEELLSFCMAIEPPYTPAKITDCICTLIRCGVFPMEEGIICELYTPTLYPRVEGWQCPLLTGNGA